MRHCLNDIRHPAMRFETHPFDAIRAGLKTTHVNAKLVEVLLPWKRIRVRDSEVMVPPSVPRNRGRRVRRPAFPTFRRVVRSGSSCLPHPLIFVVCRTVELTRPPLANTRHDRTGSI